MAIRRFAGDKFTGLAVDTKPTDVLIGATYHETDTGLVYVYDGTVWQLPDYVVPGDLALVATTGDYNDLDNLPDLTVLADVVQVANYAALPGTGNSSKVYITKDTGYMYRWSGSAYVQLTDQTAIWGQISGSIANQTDLKNALDAKFNNPSGTGAQYIQGDGALATFPTIPTVNNATLSLADSASIVNDASDTAFTANSSANKTFKVKLANSVVADIAKGVTAQGWGDHASQNYIKNIVEDTTPKLAANLDADSKKIVNLANGVSPGDAVNKSQLDAAVGSGLSLAGASGDIQYNNGTGNLGGSSLFNVNPIAKLLKTSDLKISVSGGSNSASNDSEAVFKITNTVVGPNTVVELLANLGNGSDVIFARYVV